MPHRTLNIGFVLAFALTLFFATDASAQKSKKGDEKRVLGIYTDAAGFQNNGAYELAIDEWKKLLEDYPEHPLASKANHYLGVSYIQTQKYDEAIAAFREALKNRKLEVREEALINLSWCLFTQARSAPIGSTSQKNGFREAKKSLSEFMKDYSGGDFADQALFYLGEIEYTQGNARKAIEYYRRLLGDPRFKDSKLNADTRYAIAVAYEEQKDSARAKQYFQQFLDSHSDHRLVGEVRVRLADLMLAQGESAAAEKVLRDQAGKGEMADYTLLRLGYALARQGKAGEATQQYLKLLREYPESKHRATAAISVGQNLYQAGKYDDAVKNFRLALDGEDEQAADAAHWTALTLMRQLKAKEALQVVEDALKWAKDDPTLQMDYADALYALPNELAKARSAYELIARENSDSPLAPRAGYNAAFAALQMRDYPKAREWAEWFLKRFPQDPLRNDVAYVAAETLLQEGEHAAAAKAYGQLITADRKKEHPSYDLWTLRLAMARYLDGQYKPAIELVSGAMKRFQQPVQKAEAEFILGASYLYDEQVKQAIRFLEASHKTSDQWGSADEALLLLAEAQQRAGDAESAKTSLQQFLKKYPRSRLKTQAEYKLGQLSAGTGDYDDAIARYQSIIGNDSAVNLHSFANYGVAWCRMQQERFDDALVSLNRVLDAEGSNSIRADARLAQGVCLRKVGKVTKAIEVLEKYLATLPTGMSLGNGLYELGLAYTDEGKLDLANRQFRRLLDEVASYPNRDKVLYELAWNSEELKKTDESAKYFGQLANEYPKSEFSGESVYMIAQKLYGQGNYSRAAANYEKVLGLTRDPALLEKAYYKLGWSQFQQSDFDKAAVSFEKQASQFSSGSLSVDAYSMMAECLFKKDRFAAALDGYKRARAQLEARGSNA
ncbi:MAG: tetratricopeptide repeat protein, partial [Planctomycetota bacterium]